MNENRYTNLIPTVLPYVFFLIMLFISFFSKHITINLKGFGSVLNSVITFTSIIIGVLIALFGIIVSISDSDIMQEIKKSKGERTLFRYSVETLVSNFVLLTLSIVMQIIVEYKDTPYVITLGNHSFNVFNGLANFWVASTFFMLVSSARTIYYLLMISFSQNNNSVRPSAKKNSDDKTIKLKSKYSTK